MGHKVTMYENLLDMLDREIANIERKGDLDEKSLDNLFKLTSSVKAVEKRIEKEEGKDKEKSGGESFARGRSNTSYNESMESNRSMRPYWMYNDSRMSNNYAGAYDSNDSYESYNQSGRSYGRRGRDGDGDGRYNESRESRESRDSFRDSQDRGRSGRSYEYSRDAAKKKMVQKLETLMDDTMSEKERMAIEECISQIER